ncbi:diaminobutyrate acetyltransferase [Rhodobacter sp. NTK016B]|uniref:diaminobutyrate acetyltransferase n=1 Tax=Rhodobacter sp. NTK016B TaxID=2759676 RepID=UPI001A8D9D7B|nr:diaminobutyrate acetyltransferase [Rhodobacter sp. NTK016B]MBN8294309.1 diaminobutyrate acetyltransferase [Rhodobacter sp. NTK016B]
MQHARDLFRRSDLTLRKPNAEDGADIWELVRACKPLDENSMYCNLIQCDHFRDTCVVAELDGEIVGWVSGYVLPHEPDTVFVWQVAVGEAARGLGLGGRMLSTLLHRDVCKDVSKMQTTITADNDASWALFRKFADRRDADLSSEAHFKKSVHFRDQHNTEHMVTISMEDSRAMA